MFNETNIVDDYFNKSNVAYNESNIERINDDEFVIEAKIKRVNDEGENIPEKCNECGSKICLFLKGEPVWLCSNKKCGKYFGTLPCTIQEGAWQDVRKENNKTIKECVTMSNYPSRFTSDETNEDITQEAMMDVGFNNLRMKIAQALEGKFNVTNVFKAMTGKEKFEIKSVDTEDTTKTDVESTGTGCKVITWGPVGQMKCHFNNISLSMALDKIIELFKQPELLLEGAIFSRFRTGVFMESDDGDNEDEDLDETLKDIESSVDNDDEDDDINIDSFGSDTSDQQNEYSEKDITILNHLIAGESEAINDYFDGAKDANNETLRRLYGDIGHEERFHLEQLLYAKSTLTGEKYEPRDPAVEEEYKSLLAMGMDEDTAASTAIDRLSMVGNDDGDDSDIEELEQESAIIETMLFQNEIITNICEQYSTKKIDSSVGVILEAFFQEDVFSTTNATSAERQIPNPISLLLKGIRASISGLSRMSGIIRESITKSNMKNNRKKEWIKKNGISNLFASGIELYLYSNDKIDTETPARYVDLLYRLTRQIAENSGLALIANAQHKTISNPIKFNSITDGLNIVKKTILTKTKVIVNDTNKDTLAREFFGYSEQKTNVPVKHGSSEKSVNDSNNVYNRMEVLILLTKQYCKISEEVLVQLEKKGAEPRAHEGLKLIVSKYNEFIKAIAHDLKVILKLDNGLLKLTHERDAAEQSGDKWKGPDIRVPEPNNKKTKAPHKW